MFPVRPGPTGRALALLGLSAGVLAVVLRATAPQRHPTGTTFAELLTASAGWLLLVCAVWAVLIGAAAVLETCTSGRLAATTWVCPARTRTALLAALGLALATGAHAPALGATSGAVVAGPDGSPAAATARALPPPARPDGAAGHEAASVLVRPGDTLWALATERLPRRAGPAVVAREVARTHRLNRELVGPDPDLIHPGQRLSLPRHLEEEP